MDLSLGVLTVETNQDQDQYFLTFQGERFKNVQNSLTDCIVKKRCLREWTLFLHFLILLNLVIWFCIPLVCETLLRCKYRFSSIVLRSIPVVVIRCEENEINQLDSRIETDNIRCFILLSGLRKLVAAKDEHKIL